MHKILSRFNLFIATLVIVAATFTFIRESYSYTTYYTKTLEVGAGKEFNIELNSNITTGYAWRLAEPIDENMLKLINRQYVNLDYPKPEDTNEEELLGRPGKEIWTFKALKVGTTKILFKYDRPWEPDSISEYTVYTVTIK